MAGVVLNVATGELFTATAGGGARLSTPARPEPVRLTGQPAGVAGADPGRHRASATGWSSGGRRARSSPQLLPRVRDIRRHGSAALDLCSAAAGRVDAYYELHLNPWDHAAGALVAAEAGLVVTGLPGRPFAEPMAIVGRAVDRGGVRRPVAELHAG